MSDPRLPDHRPCTLLAGVRIERGTRQDWLSLAPLHYRSHAAGAVTDVFRMVYEAPGANDTYPPCIRGGVSMHGGQTNPEGPGNHRGRSRRLIGVIVYSRSPLSLAARDRATGGRYRTAGMGRVAAGHLVNRELRIISRVVIAPNWRALGLAQRLVAETLRQVGTPYVEALAAMGQMHPMFARAGMTAYPQPRAPQAERLLAAMEAAGIDRAARRSGADLGKAIEALAPGPRQLVEREIRRWARSYLGAKNHRTNRPERPRALDLVARHLDSAPVYYLWRNSAL